MPRLLGAVVDGAPARVVLGAEMVDLMALDRASLNLWEDGFRTGYCSGVDRGRELADEEAATLHRGAVRVVRELVGIDPHEERAARAAGRPVGSLTLAPIYLRDSDSARWIVVVGKDTRARLKAWGIASVWSNVQRGCQVRTSHESDLQAACAANGVRLIDQRRAA
ncbi:MAG: hypothetical protein M3Y71_11505 [Actinomycetota bacterium]|nr:hypothetical protein [Actinomycetota bacterium]